VETLKEFERVFSAALAAGRPTLIDAKITRWAAPALHFLAPGGVIPGIWETLEERFHHG
jgi:acetolactate synthase I/II/III large subunit